MKIVGYTPIYKKEFNILDFNRSSVLFPLITRIENAKSLDDLKNKSSCDADEDLCFIYNHVGKLYFKHQNNETKVILLRFKFANHDF